LVPLPGDEPEGVDRHAGASRPGGRSARVQAAVFEATAELLRGPDWSRITMAKVAERAGVTSTTVYRRWGSLENLVGAVANATVSDRAPLADTGTLAGDIRAHSVTLVNDLTGENRRFLLRALMIAGNDAEDGSGQRALVGRTDDVRAMVGPLYGYALLLPGLVRRRAPVLVEQFLASLDWTTSPGAPGDA
jgi:AcrR family transcriptional regulator